MTSPASYAEKSRAVSPVDRVLTVVLMVGLAALVPIGGFLGLMTSMASDGCMDDSCSATLIGVGVFTSALSPAAVFLVTLGLVVRRWWRGRSTWWLPLVAVVAGVVLWFAGLMITASGAD